MADFVKATEVSAIEAGEGAVVEVDGRSIAIFNVDGTFHAIDNTCKHMGGPLGEGELDGDVVTCPWHGWEFNVTSGQSELDESVAVEKLEVKVEDGAVMVAIP